MNGKKVNIPSYLVKPGDVIAVREASRSSVKFSKLTGADAPLVTTPEWLERNKEALEGKILRMPERSDIEFRGRRALSSLSCTPSNASKT